MPIGVRSCISTFLCRIRPLAALDGRPRRPTPLGVRSCISTCRHAAAAALALTAGLGGVLTAAMPTFWTVSTQGDFLKGDVEGLSIDSDGRVFLGPSTALVAETAAPFLWTMVA